MAPHIRRGNAGRSKVRAAVEHDFVRQKGPWGFSSEPSALPGRG